MDMLAAEIRSFLVEHVTKTGGHLASNLGVVELTLAFHRVFDSPRDHIIFDVGHQSYVHKILTGRANRFDSLRQNGGLSGFTKREESPHDPFGAGHASTSLSAAIGIAEAEESRKSGAYTVCVVGDGAFTGGMIHEALNNINPNHRLIIILNENEMSISHNKGHFAEYLSVLRSSSGYHDVKNSTREFLSNIPVIGDAVVNKIKNIKKTAKNILYHSNYFENLGLYYLGPVDGNDFSTVETLLQVAKASEQSVILHLKTKKGKGFLPAEEAPDRFHSVSPASTTEYNGRKKTVLSFSDVFGRTLLRYMRQRSDLRVITAAMIDGTGLQCVAKEKPEYLVDVGIAESHALTYAAGLSAGGLYPVAAIYSSFLQRSYDNIIHDIALQKLPVTLCIDRAGFNEGDGPTHHGIFDVAMLSSLPNTEIFSPISNRYLRHTLVNSFDSGKLTAIRYPKGSEDDSILAAFEHAEPYADIKTDFSCAESSQNDVLIVTYGRIVKEALTAKALLSEQGISCGILLMEKLTPFEARADDILSYVTDNTKIIVFLEEGIYNGGVSLILRDRISRICFDHGVHTEILAIHDPFASSETGKTMAETAGIDHHAIVNTVQRFFQKNDPTLR